MRLKTHALEPLPVLYHRRLPRHCYGSVTVPDAAQGLGMLQTLHVFIHTAYGIARSPVSGPDMKYRGEPYPCMISIASTLVYPNRC